MGFDFGSNAPPNPAAMLQEPSTHIRHLLAVASTALTHREFSKAFEGVNSAIDIFEAEHYIGTRKKSTQATVIRDLIDTWRKWYFGPQSDVIFVGPPGVEKSEGFWSDKKFRLWRLGPVWTNPEDRSEAARLGNRPPLRYVIGLVPWVATEAQTTDVLGTPISHFAGVSGRIFVCYDLKRLANGEIMSSALTCRGNCLLCWKSLDTGQVFVVDRLTLGEHRRMQNETREVLVGLQNRFTHLICRLYGGAGVAEPEIGGAEEGGEGVSMDEDMGMDEAEGAEVGTVRYPVGEGGDESASDGGGAFEDVQEDDSGGF